jgi:hypothetical protein
MRIYPSGQSPPNRKWSGRCVDVVMLVAVHLVARGAVDDVDEAVEGQSHISVRARDNAFRSAGARRV